MHSTISLSVLESLTRFIVEVWQNGYQETQCKLVLTFFCTFIISSEHYWIRSAINHFDLFAIDAELEDIKSNRIASIIVGYNSYDPIVSLPRLGSHYHDHSCIYIRREYLK